MMNAISWRVRTSDEKQRWNDLKVQMARFQMYLGMGVQFERHLNCHYLGVVSQSVSSINQ